MSRRHALSYLFDSFGFAFIFLVLALGFVGRIDDELAQLAINFNIFSVFFMTGAIVCRFLYSRKVLTLGLVIFDDDFLVERITIRNFWKYQALLLFLLTLILSIIATKISLIQILEKDSFNHAMNLFSQMARPDWQILPKAIVKLIETIFIAFMATVLAFPFAFTLSFLSAKNLMGENKLSLIIYFLLRLTFNIVRSVEPVLWAIVFSIWVGFGPYAGMLALFVHSLASLTKQFSEMIEGVDDGPIEAIASTGAKRLQIIWFAIVPQLILPFISFTIYRWDINVRMATIIGFVGGGGIGATLLEAQGQAHWSQVGSIIIVVAFVVWLMDTFSTYVRQAIK